MEKEQIEMLAKAFKEASAWRADEDDIDWKDTGKCKLAYLNWAVAWRKMLEFYPDANFRIVEDANGSPVWNVNGFGMVKCAISALGVERVEIFPVMDYRNDSIPMDKLDGRDVNDSIQRGLTKCAARFGVGLYIYEGKLEAPKGKVIPTAGPKEENPYVQNRPTPQPQPYRNPTATAPKTYSKSGCTPRQKEFVQKLLTERGLTVENYKSLFHADPFESFENATRAIDNIKAMQSVANYPTTPAPKPVQQGLYEAQNAKAEPLPEDDMPF